jgi:hypothetical protein
VSNRDDVTGKWRGLHNEELCDLCSPNIIREVVSRRWAEYVAPMGDIRGAYRDLVGRPEGKRLLGRSMPKWEDNIKVDLQEVG